MEIKGPEFMKSVGKGFLMSMQCGLVTWFPCNGFFQKGKRWQTSIHGQLDLEEDDLVVITIHRHWVSLHNSPDLHPILNY
uniref:Uncharacterized protein n=1 Tax=Aegilops tauschii subsp. strangulata TaxID=200361 RepID=A0A453PFY2_AEGTS